MPKKTKKYSKLKAPRDEDETDESEGDQGLAKEDWSEGELEKAYHLNQLKIFLRKDPVMKTLKVKMLGRVHGPISPLPFTTTDLETTKAILNLLRKVGMIVGNFKAETLFDFGFEALNDTLTALHKYLKALVGEVLPKRVQGQVKEMMDPALSPSLGSLDGSSSRYEYASATSSMVSALMDTVDRMQLGPAGAAMLQARMREVGDTGTPPPRAQHQKHEDPRNTENKTEPRSQKMQNIQDASPGPSSPSVLRSYFEKAMAKFLEEQGAAQNNVSWNTLGGGQALRGRGPPHHGSPMRVQYQGPPREVLDVDMESVGSSHEEYDPDDLDFPVSPTRATVATATSGGPSTVIPHIWVSASSDLKEFTGKDHDEDRARSWSAKVKTAFIRDQVSDSEKCLIFGGLLTGPAPKLVPAAESDDTQRLETAPARIPDSVLWLGGVRSKAILSCTEEARRVPAGVFVSIKRGRTESQVGYQEWSPPK